MSVKGTFVVCRQSLYDERTQLTSQLFQRLAAGHATGDVGTETSSDEDGLAQVISIRKGLLLVIRLMPLLNQVMNEGFELEHVTQ